MSWIENNKDAGPWDFIKQPDKPHYNEGNLISDHDNPVWATDHLSFSDKPITPTHHPWCGYWYKGYGPIECNCAGITIGYTTLLMACDESQTLNAENAVEGCVYNWEIASGGGFLSSSTGFSVVYTAPSTNPSCENNVTIELSCGDVCDSILISANWWAGGEAAYHINSECMPHGGDCDYPSCTAWCAAKWCSCFPHYRCDGVYLPGSAACCGGYYKSQCLTSCQPGETIDIRTPAMIAGGCCPRALF